MTLFMNSMKKNVVLVFKLSFAKHLKKKRHFEKDLFPNIKLKYELLTTPLTPPSSTEISVSGCRELAFRHSVLNGRHD